MRPLILLAPMEGVMDHSLRDVISRVGGIDRCVSEFIRITDQLLPPRVFQRVMPELSNASRTDAGVPVRAQLLGSDPACLADNAGRLAELGAEGVDLNFGCPAKVVMRHRGGAVLLDEPELMHRIVREVRAAVPAAVPVSAKMRLGNRCEAGMLDAARALADGGAAEIVVHARTRVQGYRPPAHWHHIATIREAVAATTPVIANGEIWSVDDALRCRAESGCRSLMLGRGLVADPGLALAIRDPAAPALGWDTIAPLVRHYWQRIAGHVSPRHRAGRLKQWLQQLKRTHPQAEALWQRLRTENDPRAVQALLFSEAAPA